MQQLLYQTPLQTSDFAAMETENHFKNGASPENLMSRGKRIAIVCLCALFFCMGSIQAAPIDTFPYTNYFNSEECLSGWSFHDASLCIGLYGGGEGASFCSGIWEETCSAITPELDLESLSSPCLVVMKYKGVSVYTSVDGQNFIPILTDPKDLTSNLHKINLSKEVRFIKFQKKYGDDIFYLDHYNNDLDYVCIFDEGISTTDTFPMVVDCTPENSFRWTLENVWIQQRSGEIASRDKRYYFSIDRTLSCSVTSPKLDLSGLEKPYLLIEGYNSSTVKYVVESSTDGVLFSPVGESGLLLLPKETKYIRISCPDQTSGYSNIYRIEIGESLPVHINELPYEMSVKNSSDFAGWSGQVVGCVSNENVESELLLSGTLISPDLILPQDKKTFLFIKKSSTWGWGDVSNIRISGTTDGVRFVTLPTVSNQTVIPNNIRQIRLENTLAGSDIKKIEALIFKSIEDETGDFVGVPVSFPDAEYFYDVDGDGMKEFFKPANRTSNSSFPTDLVSYYVFKNGEVFPKDTALFAIIPQDYTLDDYSILTINKDGIPDFGLSYSRYPEQYNKVYVGSPDGYQIIPDVQGFQWDVNSDGRTDLFSMKAGTPRSWFIHQQNADGTFLKMKIDTLSQASLVDSTRYQDWEKPNSSGIFTGGGLPSLWSGFVFEKAAPPSAFDNLEVEIDLNKDGLPDLVDIKNGGVFYNMGNNRFVPGNIKGKVIAKDLNGDFITDFIVYDSESKTVKTLIYKGAGEIEEKLLFSNMVLSNVYCYDFNKDGKVDILLSFDYKTQSGYAFLVLMENKGDGVFKKHEYAYTEHFSFRLCADVNNDGYYDVVAVKIRGELHDSADSWETEDVLLLSGQAGCKFSDPEVIATTPFKSSGSFGDACGDLRLIDFDNDGRLELIISYGSNPSSIVRFDDATPNMAPQRPQAPHYVLDKASGRLKVSWQQGQDHESSSADLTYALRIGSQPGMGDVYYANANADGSRRNFKPGNMGHNLDKLLNINGWAPGNYYLSVQAIDPHFNGSAWSDETVYAHAPASTEFSVSQIAFSTTDTLTVALAGAKLPSYTYTWNLGGGRIVSQNAEGSVMDVVFDKPGETALSLQVEDPEGNFLPIYEQQLSIAPNKFVYYVDYREEGIANLNDDGIYDLVYGGIYYNDGKGNFSRAPKIYNADLSVYGKVIDFNMDGLPDIIGASNKGNLLINEGDFDFDIRTESFLYDGKSDGLSFTRSGDQFIDFNNDGYLDFVAQQSSFGLDGGKKLVKNLGDNKTFQSIDNVSFPSGSYFTDLNNDGLVDIISYMSGEVRILFNRGNFEFENKVIKLNDQGIRTYHAFGDFNSDGYIDLIVQKNRWTLVVYPGDASYSYTEQKDIPLPKSLLKPASDDYWHWHYAMIARDYDNNGYPDMALPFDDANEILYFYADWEVKLSLLGMLDNGVATRNYPFVDLNGDGSPDFIGSYNITKATNTPPSIPTNIRANIRGNKALIEWDAASDLETPQSQLRYNISIKKKGASGDNSFVISPMNGLSNTGTIVPDGYYPSATRMEVPIARFVPGSEYEIQIQSIDLWNVASPMSDAVVFRPDDLLLEAVSETCAGLETEVRLLRGTEQGAAVWEWDGATVLEGSGDGLYRIKWQSPGVKTVKATVGNKIATAQLKVNEPVDLSFVLPSTVPANTEIAFELPEMLLNPEVDYSFETSGKDINITRRSGTREAKVVFPTKGAGQVIGLVVKTPCGELTYEQIVNVENGLAVPKISIVTIDEQTGRNKIIWDKSNVCIDETVTAMAIYKEGSRYNQFYLLGEVDPKAGEYIDLTSNPQVTTARYKIAYQTTYGMASGQSDAHRSTHLLLNKGAIGNSINLMWSSYEGAVVESYRIYRGLTPETMQLLAEAPGSANSYTDMTPPTGVFYYALEYDQVYQTQWNWERTAAVRSSSDNPVLVTGMSNLISIVNAQNITLSKSINIMALEDTIKLAPQQKQLHLYTEVLPAIADYKMVNWTIVEGESLASINAAGLLTATGNANGTLVVRASAVDGSGVYAELTVPVENFLPLSIGSPLSDDKEIPLLLYPIPAVKELYVKNIHASATNAATLKVYGVNGRLYLAKEVADAETHLSVEVLPPGVYVVYIASGDGVQYRRFIKK